MRGEAILSPGLAAQVLAAFSKQAARPPTEAQELLPTLTTGPGWLSLVDNRDDTALLTALPGNSDKGDHAVEIVVGRIRSR